MSELLADYLDEERSTAHVHGEKNHICKPERAQAEPGVSEDVVAESRIVGRRDRAL
jgi:hypothetical protein